MKKWEYKTVFDPSDQQLNELGAEGWELVAVTEVFAYGTDYVGPDNMEGSTAYLKREIE